MRKLLGWSILGCLLLAFTIYLATQIGFVIAFAIVGGSMLVSALLAYALNLVTE